MDFKNMTVKECFSNPKCVAIIAQYAPQLMKVPRLPFNKKTCGEIFDLVVSKKIVPEEMAKKVQEGIEAL